MPCVKRETHSTNPLLVPVHHTNTPSIPQQTLHFIPCTDSVLFRKASSLFVVPMVGWQYQPFFTVQWYGCMSFPQPGCLSLKLLPCSPPTNPLTSEMLWLTHSYPITHHPCCLEGSTSEIRAPRVCAAAGNIEKGLWVLTGPAHTAPFLRSVIHPQNRRGHNNISCNLEP